jgi:hypothetical protein
MLHHTFFKYIKITIEKPQSVSKDLARIFGKFTLYLHTQVQDLLQIISPQEYDAAVKRCPECCPLFAVGDVRCGQQVCDSICTDQK